METKHNTNGDGNDGNKISNLTGGIHPSESQL